MTRLATMLRPHLPTLGKTLSYYVIHVVVAAGVAYVVTGSWVAALTLSLLEPTVQAVACFFHEKAWQRWSMRRQSAAASAVPAMPQTVPT